METILRVGECMRKHSNPNCKSCMFRAAANAINGCDYILVTRHMRGCPAEKCDKYKRGKRITRDDYLWKYGVM